MFQYLDVSGSFFHILLQKLQIFVTVLLLFIEEAGVPLPVPGDIVITYVGYEASKGLILYPIAFFLFLFSILLGSSILFYFSSRFGHSLIIKFGKFIGIDEKKVIFIEDKFKKYGPWAILVGRFIPGLRVAVTIVAGISGVKYKTFILSTGISSCIWIVFFLWLGVHFGPKAVQLFTQYRNFLSIFLILFLLLVALYLLRVSKKEASHR